MYHDLRLEVRGEVFMPRASFERLNRDREAASGRKGLRRRAAAGGLGRRRRRRKRHDGECAGNQGRRDQGASQGHR